MLMKAIRPGIDGGIAKSTYERLHSNMLHVNDSGRSPSNRESVACKEASELGRPPTLNKPEYFTSPSMEELENLHNDDPTMLANVKNFTIGRGNIGKVQFCEEVDLRDVDVGSIVNIEQGEVVVNAGDDERSRVQRFREKPVVITLYNIFPKNMEGERRPLKN
eukprot:gene16456-19535_t